MGDDTSLGRVQRLPDLFREQGEDLVHQYLCSKKEGSVQQATGMVWLTLDDPLFLDKVGKS